VTCTVSIYHLDGQPVAFRRQTRALISGRSDPSGRGTRAPGEGPASTGRSGRTDHTRSERLPGDTSDPGPTVGPGWSNISYSPVVRPVVGGPQCWSGSEVPAATGRRRRLRSPTWILWRQT
jgi:hypothetical protein